MALVISMLIADNGIAQTQFNPKVGFETWTIADEVDQGGSSHSGQTIGFDMFIISNRFAFVPGFYYHRFSILNQEDGLVFEIPKRNGVHYFSIPMTVGMQILDLKVFDATIMAGGEINFFYSLDSNDISLDDDKLHSVFGAITGGVQAQIISFLTLDLKYHYALHPIIKARPESKLRGWTLAAGIRF